MFEMEAIQMLTARLDQISHKFDSMQMSQSAWSNGSCEPREMFGHLTSEYLPFNRGTTWEEVNAQNERSTGDTYPNPYLQTWHDNDSSSTSAPYQPHYMQNQHPCDFSYTTANQYYEDPLQMAWPAPQKPRTEELLEQLILSQQEREKPRTEELLEQLLVAKQKTDLDNEQKFQQLFSECDQLRAQNDAIEYQLALMSAGPSQWDDEVLPSPPEAISNEEVQSTILQSGKQLETSEPEGQGSEEHIIETQASDFSSYTDSCFRDYVYDRFMELERSGKTTDQQAKDSKPAQMPNGTQTLQESSQTQSKLKGSRSSSELSQLHHGVIENGMKFLNTMKNFIDVFKENGVKAFDNSVKIKQLV